MELNAANRQEELFGQRPQPDSRSEPVDIVALAHEIVCGGRRKGTGVSVRETRALALAFLEFHKTVELADAAAAAFLERERATVKTAGLDERVKTALAALDTQLETLLSLRGFPRAAK